MIADEEVVEKKLNPQQRAHQKEIEASILVLAAAVIRCDRNYTHSTEKYISDFIAKNFGGAVHAKRIKSVGEHIDGGTEPFVIIACKELKLLTTHDSRIHIVNFLFGVADSDDYINAKETRCIHRIARYLDVNDKDFKQVKELFVRENNPYKILGIEEGATLVQVKAAYRKMILKFHPDKRDEGITEEEANAKFRDIQRAFEVIEKILDDRQ